MARENFPGAGQQDFGGLCWDYRTGILTAAIIALSLLLGWMVGRAGWNMALNRAEIQTPDVSENVAAAQVSLDPVAKSPSADAPIEGTQSTRSALRSLPQPDPAPKSNREAAEPNGGLMMFEHNKVIFRAVPSETKTQTEGKGNSDSRTAPDQVARPVASHYLVSRVVPEYPEQAKQQHVQGPVVLNALVGTGGSVQEIKVISGEPELVQAAVAAVRQWRFQPQKLEGNPVEFETRITVNFSLP